MTETEGLPAGAHVTFPVLPPGTLVETDKGQRLTVLVDLGGFMVVAVDENGKKFGPSRHQMKVV